MAKTLLPYTDDDDDDEDDDDGGFLTLTAPYFRIHKIDGQGKKNTTLARPSETGPNPPKGVAIE